MNKKIQFVIYFSGFTVVYPIFYGVVNAAFDAALFQCPVYENWPGSGILLVDIFWCLGVQYIFPDKICF